MRLGTLLALLLLPVAAAAGEHVVASGDTLGGIAAQHGCSVEDIQRANKINGTLIHPGDKLRIPRCGGSTRGSGTTERAPARRTADKKNEKKADKKADKKPKKKVKKEHRGKAKLDSKTLPELLRKRGFRKPHGFKALVIEFTLDPSRTKVVAERPFDYNGTSRAADDWNPASTIKLFSAISALELVHSKGLRPQVEATFFDFGGKKKRSHKVSELVHASIVDSDNLAHNRLVQLAGYDRLNGDFLSPRRGVVRSAIHKPYEKSRWVPLTGQELLKDSPKIVLGGGKKARTLPERKGKGDYTCRGSSACTTLADLAEAMRRMMLHEQLPKGETYRLSLAELRVLRHALKEGRKRGMGVVDNLLKAFKQDEVVFFHKPGFSEDWVSDIIYVYKRSSRRRWIVAIAGHGGREVLNSAARALGQILADDELAEH